MPITYHERRYRDDSLIKQPSEIPMVSSEGENRVRHGFLGQRHIGVGLQFLQYLITCCPLTDAQIKPDAMHVLRIELDGGRKQIQIQSDRLEEMPGIFGVVRAKFHILVLADLWRWDEAAFLTDIRGTPQAEKPAPKQIIRRLMVQGEGINQDGQVMRITTDDVNKAVFTRHKHRVVDAVGIHLAKAKFTPLGDKASRRRHVLIPFLLVLKPQAF